MRRPTQDDLGLVVLVVFVIGMPILMLLMATDPKAGQ